MPRCLNCGNTEVFESTGFQGVLYPASGLVGHFGEDGRIKNMENLGASPESLAEAWQRPEICFDLCQNCGCGGILWP